MHAAPVRITPAVVVANLVRHAIFVTLLVPMLVVEASGQQRTIPEAIASGAVSKTTGSPPSGGVPTMQSLVTLSDVVVVGTLANQQTRLSDDQTDIWTTFDVLDPIFVKPTSMATTAQPGTAPSLTFVQIGGTLTINGTPFTQREGVSVFTSGMRGLFMLKRRAGRLVLVDNFYGAFGVEGNVVFPVYSRRDDFARDVASRPLADVLATLATYVSR